MELREKAWKMSERNSWGLEVLHRNSPNISPGIVTSAIDYVSLAERVLDKKEAGPVSARGNWKASLCIWHFKKHAERVEL